MVLFLVLVLLIPQTVFASERLLETAEDGSQIITPSQIQAIFEDEGYNVSSGSTFGLVNVSVSGVDDVISVPCMITREGGERNSFQRTVIVSDEESEEGDVRLLSCRELLEEPERGSASGVRNNVTATGYYYYLVDQNGYYYYKPWKVSFRSSVTQTVQCEYRIGGPLFNSSLTNLHDDDTFAITMANRTASAGTTYSKEGSTPYYYYVYSGSWLCIHRITLAFSGGTEAYISMPNGLYA